MSDYSGWVVSVNVNEGGVPKYPQPDGDRLTVKGLSRDSQGHEKHCKPSRALSILSIELLETFQKDGYSVAPGLLAENLTVFGVDLNAMAIGTRMVFDDGPEVEVTEQRRPCYQLNPIGEGLEDAAVGRSGVMCSVITEGDLKPGMRFKVVTGD